MTKKNEQTEKNKLSKKKKILIAILILLIAVMGILFIKKDNIPRDKHGCAYIPQSDGAMLINCKCNIPGRTCFDCHEEIYNPDTGECEQVPCEGENCILG